MTWCTGSSTSLAGSDHEYTTSSLITYDRHLDDDQCQSHRRCEPIYRCGIELDTLHAVIATVPQMVCEAECRLETHSQPTDRR